jgi:voltage-gated potassium channel
MLTAEEKPDPNANSSSLRDTVRSLVFRDLIFPPLEQDLGPPLETELDRFEARFAPWSFRIALLYLVVMGLALVLVPDPDLAHGPEISKALGCILASLWLYFLLELILFASMRFRSGLSLREGLWKRRVLVLLFPPGHLCLRHSIHGDLCWLPGWKWSRANSSLFERLKEKLELPMIGIALLIVPLLLVEWKGMAHIGPVFPGGTSGLHTTLQVGQALIWTAFAMEFLLMVSLARSRLGYCKEAWLDILIILLPLISFLRSARVLRAARLNQVARGYRFRSVAIKIRRAVLLANAVQKLIEKDPEKQALALLKKSREYYLKYCEKEAPLLLLLDELDADERERILKVLEEATTVEEQTAILDSRGESHKAGNALA